MSSSGGQVVNGAYQSGDESSNRDILYTVADFQPTESIPLHLSAKLTFNNSDQIAFIGTRSDALRNPGYANEPDNSLYFRIHNFIEGYTGISSTSFDGRPGDGFYQSPVMIELIDNGINISGTITNIQSGQVLSFNENSTFSSGLWKVIFSGGPGAAWDDIKISFGEHEFVQEYDDGSNSLAGVSVGLGETTIIWTAQDAAGNSTSESLIVTVEDNQDPSLSVFENLAGQSESSVNWETTVEDVVFGDNCTGAILTWHMTGASTASGIGQVGTHSFSPGITTITYTVTDASGNTTSEAMTVENTKEFFCRRNRD